MVQLTNSSGAVTKSYTYDAFGVEKDPVTTDTNLFRYCAEYWDGALVKCKTSEQCSFDRSFSLSNRYIANPTLYSTNDAGGIQSETATSLAAGQYYLDLHSIMNGNGAITVTIYAGSTLLYENVLSQSSNAMISFNLNTASKLRYGFQIRVTGNGTSPSSAYISLTNLRRITGEIEVTGSGMYYLRARYYEPVLGRFTSEDPIRDGLNWYTYCGGNPVSFVDPSGLVYIIAWSYSGARDILPFEKNYLNKNGFSVTADGGTLDWGNAEWAEFDKRSTFSRAAQTKKNELIKSGVFESEIVLQRIDDVGGLKNAWSQWSKYAQVDQLHFFSHGYSEAAEVNGGSGDFWDNASTLNWNSDAGRLLWPNPSVSNYLGTAAFFYGCNTANGNFAQHFANTQNVTTYAQTDFTNFSSNTKFLFPVDPWGTGLGVYMRTFNWKAVKDKLHVNTIGVGKQFEPK